MMSFDKSQMVLFLELSLRPTKDSHLYRLNGVALTESSHNAFNRREFIHGALGWSCLRRIANLCFLFRRSRPPVGAEPNTEDA